MLHIPRLPAPAAQKGGVVRRLCLLRKLVGCALVLLSVLLHAHVATAQLTAQLTVNPSSLNFGSVPTGSSAMLALILSNSGGSSLKISQAAVTGSGFSLGTLPLPLTLAAGQSRTFSVTYTPTSAGTEIGSLSLSWAPVLRRCEI